MPDYQKGKIYCIRSHQTDKVYVGSTVQTLSKRMCGHRSDLKKYKNGKYHHITSFDILEYDDAYIELIEDFPSENKNQLEKREGHFIREMDCVNKVVAGRDGKEWREDNKDKLSDYNKERYEANKDIIKEKVKEYYEDNKDKIKQQKKEYCEANKDIISQKKKEYYEDNKEKVKEYCEANKDKIKQRNKEYHEANKDKIHQRKRDRRLKKKQESNSI